MKIAFYCRVDGQGFGVVLPKEADKLREFFAEHQDKPALENVCKSEKKQVSGFFFCAIIKTIKVSYALFSEMARGGRTNADIIFDGWR